MSAPPFFLPQRRPRVWALFLKVRGGMGPKAIRECERDLEEAFDFIMSSQTSCHEPLKRILDRTPTPHEPLKGTRRPPKVHISRASTGSPTRRWAEAEMSS